MRIVTKVGSSVVTDKNKGINKRVLHDICSQLARLKLEGHEIIHVSSGAVSSCPINFETKNAKAAVGQCRIVRKMDTYFEPFGIYPGQILVTDEQLFNSLASSILLRTINDLHKGPVVIVVNGNDTVSDVQLCNMEKSADNDSIALELFMLWQAELLITLFDQDGILDRSGKVINLINEQNLNDIRLTLNGGNNHTGKDGILVKYDTCVDAAKSAHGQSILIPGKDPEGIIKAVNQTVGFGTRFIF